MLRRDRLVRERPGIPPDLPDHLRYPVIEVDDAEELRWAAWNAWSEYARELSGWLVQHGHQDMHPAGVMAALGTTLDAFVTAVAEDGTDREA